MNMRALTTAAVRFFALYTLLSCIDTAAELAVSIGLPKEITGGGMPYVVAVNLVVSLGVAWFLLARTHTVTGWVLRGQASGDEEVAFTAGDLAALAFYVAGLIFLVSGLESILGQAFGWYFAPRRLPTPGGAQLGRMAGSGVKVAAGVWLLLQARRSRPLSGSGPRS